MEERCKTCGGERTITEDRWCRWREHYTVEIECPDCMVREYRELEESESLAGTHRRRVRGTW